MGWKASMIIINSEQTFDQQELFESLGYFELEKKGSEYFDSIMNPEEDLLYIGKYKGNTIICMQGLPLESMEESLSNAESILSFKFPDTDITTFILHSVVNLWGYSIAKNGKKVRVRIGSSEGGTMVDFGDMMEEEKELFAQSKLKENGERIFVLDDMPEEVFAEDQVGENFVFDISRKYFGESLDACDELLETKFQGYTFVKRNVEMAVKMESVPVASISDSTMELKKPWWKFW